MSLRKKILIIEDDQILAEMYQLKFINNGYSVDILLDGSKVGNYLKTNKPDLIVLDIILPGQNGLMILKKMRKKSDSQNIPVVILTNLSQTDIDMNEHLAKVLGIRDYLIKAKWTPSKVVERVQKIIGEA
ncbi:MAG: response regulator [bacterium]|nr:response regulator [bacterium]